MTRHAAPNRDANTTLSSFASHSALQPGELLVDSDGAAGGALVSLPAPTGLGSDVEARLFPLVTANFVTSKARTRNDAGALLCLAVLAC
jgi:hypothetical protein